nr:unnamed protein product [Callosobruchus analis]
MPKIYSWRAESEGESINCATNISS